MQQIQNDYGRDLELGSLTRTSPGVMPLNDFFNEVQHIDGCISTINESVRAIEELHLRSMDLASNEESHKNSLALDKTINDTRLQLIDTKNRIRAMEANNLKLGVSSDAQIRKNRHIALKTKFMDTLKNYQNVEVKYKEKYRQMMERQIRIVNPNATDAEIEEALDNEQGGVFAQAIMNTNRTAEARNVCKAVQDRHEDIVKIEKTILELANLFQEMQLLVETQDEVVHQIETQMAEAVVHTGEANRELTGAIGHAVSARKKRWCLFIFFFIILIVIILVVYFQVKK
ncbi:hypothetical protein K7432_002015 [Basidiobolus ranarum]|uniref:t-SNARE coiled-coil homology domain-containing protein n=1 Tax=Basidiobolus ranarum TaxID=34480 RepID=A0ABR2W8Q5_9FUNG